MKFSNNISILLCIGIKYYAEIDKDNNFVYGGVGGSF